MVHNLYFIGLLILCQFYILTENTVNPKIPEFGLITADPPNGGYEVTKLIWVNLLAIGYCLLTTEIVIV